VATLAILMCQSEYLERAAGRPLDRTFSDGARALMASLAAQGVSLPRGAGGAAPLSPSARDDASVATLLRSLSLDAAGGAAGTVDALRARLEALPASALRNLILDDAAFAALLAEAAAASEAAALAEQLRASVVDAAQRNLRLAAEAADLRSQCAIVRATDFAPAKAAYDEAAARQAALLQRCAPAALLAALGAAAAEDDAAAEALEAQLLAGEVAPDAFLKQFRPLRRRYHMRQLKRAASAHLTMS
jgi:ESCRT-I complex subunit VPS37